MMDIKQLLLSFDGRIGRRTFWIGFLYLSLISFAAGIVAGFFAILMGIDPFIIAALVSLPLIYPMLALYTKRWHDRDKSGNWNFILLIPYIGGFWAFIELGFLVGTEGDNQYGPDPFIKSLDIATTPPRAASLPPQPRQPAPEQTTLAALTEAKTLLDAGLIDAEDYGIMKKRALRSQV